MIQAPTLLRGTVVANGLALRCTWRPSLLFFRSNEKSSVFDMFLFRKHKTKTPLKKACVRERELIVQLTDFLEDLFYAAFLDLAINHLQPSNYFF